MITTELKHIAWATIQANKMDAKEWKNRLVRFISTQNSSPYLPFKIVKYMANFCLAPFVQSSAKFVFNRNLSRHAKTSCIDNLYALTIIFSGMTKAKFLVNERLTVDFSIPIGVKLPGGSNWDFKVSHLFTGKAILDKRIQENQQWSNISDEVKRQAAIDAFENVLQRTVEKCSQFQLSPSTQENDAKFLSNLEIEFNNLKHDFNEGTFASLKNDILSNEHKVNAQASYIYYIAITLPVNNGDTEFYHAFAIEQFSGLNGISHRLYNSWIMNMTLLEYFQKKGYRDQDEGCLTTEQMLNYIDDVHGIVSPITHPADKSRLIKKCFFQTSYQHPPNIQFNPQSRTLKGIAVRYVAQEFNPKDTLDNFHEFIKAQANPHSSQQAMNN